MNISVMFADVLLNIEEIQKKIDERTLQAGLPRHSVNLCTAPIGDGTPYVTFENDVYQPLRLGLLRIMG